MAMITRIAFKISHALITGNTVFKPNFDWSESPKVCELDCEMIERLALLHAYYYTARGSGRRGAGEYAV